jgi:hypothetical protein
MATRGRGGTTVTNRNSLARCSTSTSTSTSTRVLEGHARCVADPHRVGAQRGNATPRWAAGRRPSASKQEQQQPTTAIDDREADRQLVVRWLVRATAPAGPPRSIYSLDASRATPVELHRFRASSSSDCVRNVQHHPGLLFLRIGFLYLRLECF